MTEQPKTIGILAGGGPAPGINSVIHAVTIRAINLGFKVNDMAFGRGKTVSSALNAANPGSRSNAKRLVVGSGSMQTFLPSAISVGGNGHSEIRPLF